MTVAYDELSFAVLMTRSPQHTFCLLCVWALAGCSYDWAVSKLAEPDAGEPRDFAIASLNGPCRTDGARACTGHAVTQPLVCRAGTWQASGECDELSRCDTAMGATQGQCRPVVVKCRGRESGESFCESAGAVNCAVDLLAAQIEKCDSGTSCVLESGEAMCRCSEAGSCQGGRCQSSENDCSPAATCQEPSLGTEPLSCACPPGFDGSGHGPDGCVDIDECGLVADRCQGLPCVNEQGSYRCGECPTGFTGSNCEVVVDDCTGNKCVHGICQDEVAGYSCRCPVGYSGKYCEEANNCAPNPCQHGGTCTVGVFGVGFTCTCTAEYHGALCQSDDWCAPGVSACDNVEYPCARLASGYYCEGQSAAWSMPDNLAVAASQKYAVSDQGTSGAQDDLVEDLVTGLAWQRSPPATYPGCSGFWETDPPGTVCTWPEARSYCDNLVLGGFADWRLPSKVELESLIDDTRTQPAIDVTAFVGTKNERYYTKSHTSDGRYVFTVDFARGTTGYNTELGYPLSARCVRVARAPAQISHEQHYTVDEQGTNGDPSDDFVTDNFTGFRWERVGGRGMKYTLDQARAYCSTITRDAGGFRLPTRKELLTLIDPRFFAPAVDDTVFPEVLYNESAWSSTPVIGYQNVGWSVQLQSGGAYSSPSSTLYSVRCIKRIR